ncbi:hypothetical protein Pint_26808 [Pistacia integerrima]|uniref:Uncharacterized protein n=1 Tax=Pistacia integerrima TaxID=434235 RepID=A0ACC0YSX7_9ROSI|nr:hypothetical protein Pint_26808 [Pistacia integerrima]
MGSKEVEFISPVAISGNRQISSETIIAITVPASLVFIIILSTSCYCVLRWKERRNYKAVKDHGNGDHI